MVFNCYERGSVEKKMRGYFFCIFVYEWMLVGECELMSGKYKCVGNVFLGWVIFAIINSLPKSSLFFVCEIPLLFIGKLICLFPPNCLVTKQTKIILVPHFFLHFCAPIQIIFFLKTGIINVDLKIKVNQ